MLDFPTASGRINLAESIGDNSYSLTIHLLEDGDGSILQQLKSDSKDSKEMMVNVFSKWLTGSGDKSWGYLLTCLKKSKLGALAENIENAIQHNEGLNFIDL